MKYPYNVEAVQSALNELDLNSFVTDLFESADVDEPVAAYLDAKCRVQIAETMCEVDGLLLCSVRHVDPENDDEPWYEFPRWISSVDPDRFKEIESALDAAAMEYFVAAGGNVDDWGKD